MSSQSTVIIGVAVGLFLILTGTALLVIGKLPASAHRGFRGLGNTGATGLTELVLVALGVACLSVVVISNSNQNDRAGTTPTDSSTTPAVATPALGPTLVPTSGPSPANSITALPSTRGQAETVSVLSPRNGDAVSACDVFSGISRLAAADTIVLSVRNLSDPSGTLYLEPVHNWATPGALAHWVGFQYFGSGDSSVGQTYEVGIVIMKISLVRASLAESVNTPTWHVASLPPGSRVKHGLRLTRISGPGPVACR